MLHQDEKQHTLRWQNHIQNTKENHENTLNKWFSAKATETSNYKVGIPRFFY